MIEKGDGGAGLKRKKTVGYVAIHVEVKNWNTLYREEKENEMEDIERSGRKKQP